MYTDLYLLPEPTMGETIAFSAEITPEGVVVELDLCCERNPTDFEQLELACYSTLSETADPQPIYAFDNREGVGECTITRLQN